MNFAAQIDKSKSVIQKSHDKTQLLFDSLMQNTLGREKMEKKDRESSITQKDIDLMLDMLTWNASEDFSCDNLYHYYSGETIKKVLKSDKISFRLAEAATFDDKLELKATEAYFDLALDELKKEGIISETEFFELSNIEVPQRTLLMHPSHSGFGVWGQEEFEEYIICFATEKDSRYMFENYIDRESDGYCVEFYETELKEICHKAMNNCAEMAFIKVLYGREIIEYLKKKIMEVMTQQYRKNNATLYIESLLHFIQFSAKRSKFSKEKEIRLVVLLPKGCCEILPDIAYCKSKGKRYIYFNVRKDPYSDISPAPYNTKADNAATKEYLDRNGYASTQL